MPDTNTVDREVVGNNEGLTSAEQRLRDWLRQHPEGGEMWLIVKGGFQRSHDLGRADGLREAQSAVEAAADTAALPEHWSTIERLSFRSGLTHASQVVDALRPPPRRESRDMPHDAPYLAAYDAEAVRWPWTSASPGVYYRSETVKRIVRDQVTAAIGAPEGATSAHPSAAHLNTATTQENGADRG